MYHDLNETFRALEDEVRQLREDVTALQKEERAMKRALTRVLQFLRLNL